MGLEERGGFAVDCLSCGHSHIEPLIQVILLVASCQLSSLEDTSTGKFYPPCMTSA